MREHFRGVVWPRRNPDAQGRYRYAVVGCLVTDKPLEFDEKNEIVLDGHAAGMSDSLQTIVQKVPNIVLGDATNVLLSLDILCD